MLCAMRWAGCSRRIDAEGTRTFLLCKKVRVPEKTLMLEISDLTFRFGSRALFDGANAFLSAGWKVGLVGRNGTGKSTLLKLIKDEAQKGSGSIRLQRGARMGFVAQEVAASDEALIDVVLAADEERAALMAEAETAEDGNRIGEIHMRLAEIDAYSAEARASEILVGFGFAQSDLTPCDARVFRRLADARGVGGGVVFDA